jgi:hypothetical protein
VRKAIRGSRISLPTPLSKGGGQRVAFGEDCGQSPYITIIQSYITSIQTYITSIQSYILALEDEALHVEPACPCVSVSWLVAGGGVVVQGVEAGWNLQRISRRWP